MAIIARLIVTDPKGIRVGTWSREDLHLQPGQVVNLTNIGQSMLPESNKMLVLSGEAMDNLVKHKRVRRETL